MKKAFELSYEDFLEKSEKKTRNQEMKAHFKRLEKITDKWGVIRQVYMENIGDIMSHFESGAWSTINAHLLDWQIHLSPIEFRAWVYIHSLPIPLYPQFPVFNWFIDFASPYHKIGFECDGKDYHDPVKDKKRDEFLALWGWKIFRVTGKECTSDIDDELNNCYEHEEREQLLEKWYLNSYQGVLTAIAMKYFKGPNSEMKKDSWSIVHQTLDKHRYADFEL